MPRLDDESGFLAALARDPDDDGLRAVYADWLEERGDARAEWVRLEAGLACGLRELRTAELAVRQAVDEQLEAPERALVDELAAKEERRGHCDRRVAALREALAEVGPVDPPWVAAVARLPIENCDVWSRLVRLRYRCPDRWEALEPTVTEGVRTCRACRRYVFFCADLEAAVTHARAGNRVAVAPQVPRRPGDLDAVEMLLGEMEASAGWPEGLDRAAVRPFAHVFRALQRAFSPSEGPEIPEETPVGHDSPQDDG
jgi:uncharacterized protein (TIGR02996 family)